MAITVTHPFVSAIADDPAAAAAGQVVPSNWNATHSLSGTLDVANGGTGTTTSTGTGSVVLSSSPALTTPDLGTPSAIVLTNASGTASININGTVGATTPSTGAFTTLSSTGNTTLGDASSDTVTINGTVQPGVIISGSSAGNALRITQTGTGNALLVEDSTNPDTTPFVVNADGNVGIGTTAPLVNFHAQANTSLGVINYTAGGGTSYLFRRASGTTSSPTIVASGDIVSAVAFQGYDGSNFINAAQISSNIDGTPGTNDMPGRLVFSTTADGASSPTERMRINSAGQVGFGGIGGAGQLFNVVQNITGATSGFGVWSGGQIQSDVTSQASYFVSIAATAAASFTLANLNHYNTFQSTFGAGSTVTSQYGFVAAPSLTGATNNFGFYSNLASSTGRWNFYAAGTAANYFAGSTYVLGTGGDQALNVNGAVRVANTTSANQTSAGTMDFTSGAMRFLVWGASSVQGTFSWWTGTGALGVTQRMTLDGSANLGLATSTFGTSATNTFAVFTGTAPTTGPADTVQFYSTDLSAGNTIPSFYTEGTNVGTGTPTADRTIAIRMNGTVYYLLASTIP